jgi:hypothetical protein
VRATAWRAIAPRILAPARKLPLGGHQAHRTASDSRPCYKEPVLRPTIAACALLSASVAASQEPAPAYQAEKQYSFDLHLDGLVRQEFNDEGLQLDTDRQRVRLLPRFEAGINRVVLGLGGDFAWGSDDNTSPVGGAPRTLVRDNFRSDEARLDLAFLAVRPASWLRLHAGRFTMPVALTELVWDRDLRPQGLAATLEARPGGAVERLALTGLGARGSHVFEDGHVEMLLGTASAVFGFAAHYHLELLASFLTFDRLSTLDRRIRRQNSRRADGTIANDYEVADAVARLRRDGRVPVQLVGDYCRNTAVDSGNEGMWAAAVIGSTRENRLRAEYTYGFVDPDATVAAYNGDDFIWATGWEGHRGDLGLRLRDHYALHGVAQTQRFKDSPRAADRHHWVRRYRIELRVAY